MRFGSRKEGIFILLDEEETQGIVKDYSKNKNCSFIFISGENLNSLKNKLKWQDHP